jgi:hypothetical protein
MGTNVRTSENCAYTEIKYAIVSPSDILFLVWSFTLKLQFQSEKFVLSVLS